MYLDYAENQAARQIPMKMADWIEKLDGFLRFNEYDILTNAGSVHDWRCQGRVSRKPSREARVRCDGQF